MNETNDITHRDQSKFMKLTEMMNHPVYVKIKGHI